MKKLKFPTLSKVSMNILKIGLAPVALTFIYIAFSRASQSAYDAARLYPLFYELIEHALMSFAIVICGALLFDIASREER